MLDFMRKMNNKNNKQKGTKMTSTTKLTQEQLKELIHYNPETGVFKDKLYTPRRIIHGDKIQIKSSYYSKQKLAYLYIEGWLPKQAVKLRDRTKGYRYDNLILYSHQRWEEGKIVGVNPSQSVNSSYWVANIRESEGLSTIPKTFETKVEAVKARYDHELKNSVYSNIKFESCAYKWLVKKGLIHNQTENMDEVCEEAVSVEQEKQHRSPINGYFSDRLVAARKRVKRAVEDLKAEEAYIEMKMREAEANWESNKAYHINLFLRQKGIYKK